MKAKKKNRVEFLKEIKKLCTCNWIQLDSIIDGMILLSKENKKVF